jgi:hypothetical protein
MSSYLLEGPVRFPNQGVRSWGEVVVLLFTPALPVAGGRVSCREGPFPGFTSTGKLTITQQQFDRQSVP